MLLLLLLLLNIFYTIDLRSKPTKQEVKTFYLI